MSKDFAPVALNAETRRFPRPAPPVKPNHHSSSGPMAAALAGGAGLLLGGLLAIALLTVWLVRSDFIMPGAQSMGVPLGGKSTDEAALALAEAWQSRAITLQSGAGQQPVRAEALGVMFDIDATVAEAHAIGRTWAGLKQLAAAGWQATVWPQWSLNDAVAEQTLLSLAPQVAVPPVNADIRIAGGRAETVPAVAGRALDVPATINALRQELFQIVSGKPLAMVFQPVEPAVTNVTAAVDEANRLLGNTISARIYDPITDETFYWEIPGSVWGGWLHVSLDGGQPPSPKMQIVPAAVEEFLLQKSAELGGNRYLEQGATVSALTAAIEGESWYAGLRAYHFNRQHVVQAGETLSAIGYDYGIPYPWLQQANPGVDSLAVGQTITIPSRDVFLPLPVIENKRIIISLSRQMMWIYENGGLKWAWPVSTGIESSPTSPGVFQIRTHFLEAYASNWNLYMPYFMGIYQPVPNNDFMNGFHGFPTRDGSALLWTSSLGHPVTYGCILVDSANIPALYSWAEEGVVVEIQK